MGMAADQCRFEHRRREEIDGILRQVAAKKRALARAESCERRSIVGDLARSRDEESGERRDERRLAGAVWTDDRPAFAGAHVEIESGDERASSYRQREGATRKTGCVARHARPRDSNARNTGTPTSAVITPTGN